MDDFHVVHTGFHQFHATTPVTSMTKLMGCHGVGAPLWSHKHCWHCAARKSVEIFNYFNGELKSVCVSSAMKSAKKGCKMLKQWQAPCWRMQHVVIMRRVSKRSVFFQRQTSNRRKKVMSPSPSQYCHLYAISSLNSH